MNNKSLLTLVTIGLVLSAIVFGGLLSTIALLSTGTVQAASDLYQWTEYREVAHISDAQYYTQTNLNHPDIVAYNPRPNACHTYNLGGYDATEGKYCEYGTTMKQTQDNPIDDSPIIVDVITDDSIIDSDNPPAEKEGKVKNNNGHGNNDDSVDCSNPGKSKQGDDSNPAVDDEKAKGKNK